MTPKRGHFWTPFWRGLGGPWQALAGPARFKADLPRILACNGPVWAKGAQTLKIGVPKQGPK